MRDYAAEFRNAAQLADAVSRVSLSGFLRHVVIDSAPNPKRFGDIADDWQWEITSQVAQAIEAVGGIRPDYSGPRSFWRGLPRGHDKTGMTARLLLWALCYSRRPLEIVTAAADADQAGLILESARKEALYNPWIWDKIKFLRKGMSGPGGKLTVLSSNAPTSYGLLCDLIIVDELTWWQNRDLWDALWSGREKRPGSVVIVISNAGCKGSWQHHILEVAKTDPTWDVYLAPGSLASWMTAEAIERLRRMLPTGLARRVLDNIWVDPGEDVYLGRDDILHCVELAHELGLVSTQRGESGVRYVAGIDYGPKRDRTAMSVVHRTKHTSPTVVVDRLDVLQGNPESPVALLQVENWISEVIENFGRPTFVIDPYQMESIIQELELRYEVIRHEARGGKANYALAENLRSLISNGKMAWPKGMGDIVTSEGIDTLADEFGRLIIKLTPYGYRFDHPRGYHDDRVVALGMAAIGAVQQDPSSPGVPPPQLSKKKSSVTKKRVRRSLFGQG